MEKGLFLEAFADADGVGLAAGTTGAKAPDVDIVIPGVKIAAGFSA